MRLVEKLGIPALALVIALGIGLFITVTWLLIWVLVVDDLPRWADWMIGVAFVVAILWPLMYAFVSAVRLESTQHDLERSQ